MGNQDVVNWLSAHSRICSKHVETHSLAIEELTRRCDELEGKQGAAVGAVAEQVRDSEQRVLVAVAERFGNVMGSLGTRLDEAETGAEEIEKNMLNLTNSFDEFQSKFDTDFFSSLESNFADLRAEFRSHQAKITPPVACVPSRVMPRKSEKLNVTNTEKSKVSRSTASNAMNASSVAQTKITPSVAAMSAFSDKSDAERFSEFLGPTEREYFTQDEIAKMWKSQFGYDMTKAAKTDLGLDRLPPGPRVPTCGNDKTEVSNPAENRRPKIDNKHKGLRHKNF